MFVDVKRCQEPTQEEQKRANGLHNSFEASLEIEKDGKR